MSQCFLNFSGKMKLLLFTDGSVNTKLRVGYGAYLAFSEGQQSLTGHIKLKRFEDTSSSKMELQILLWALSEISAPEVMSYTDSQNIVGLNSRRKKLEENVYYARNGKRLKNHELYKQFYQRTDNLNITVTQIKGHTLASRKSNLDMIFSLVDRASRKALRAYTANYNSGIYV
jgi:ribonuclease HI